MAPPPSASPATTSLLGPPEIRHCRPQAKNPPPTEAAATAPGKEGPICSDPFMDLMTSGFKKVNSPLPRKGLTENLSPTFVSTGNPCLDFFFHVVPDTPEDTVVSLLGSAWDHDALTSLKLVYQLRGIRGTGKSDRESFYTAAVWLHNNHPKTLALNVAHVASFGYIKDLPEILHRILDGVDVRRQEKAKRAQRGRIRRTWFGCSQRRQRKKEKKEKKVREKQGTTEERIARELARVKIEMEDASKQRKKKRAEMALRALERYNRDPDYRFLHDRIADYFAAELLADLKHLRSGNIGKIGLASKWCPSIDSSYDRSTLLCESIARRIFPRESSPEYSAVEDEHYAYRVRDRLRKEVLVPLRKALELPEIYISANKWNELPYKRVASVAFKNYKKLFRKHDKERFQEYLEKVERGEAKIAAGALLPHELVAAVGAEEEDKVAELQWRRMVEDLSKKGKMRNCIAVCDVSGSMEGTPMDVAVALGILTSDLSEEPWRGNLITFSADPQMQRVVGETLKEKASFVKKMDWGMNTDFQGVFDRILEVAAEGNLAPEQMVKRIFVFSDMEFDQASNQPWETDYEAIQRKFRETGYGSVVPEVVFWNLRSSRSTPVMAEQKGVAMVSGFSKNLMTMFLEKDGAPTPLSVMEAALMGKEYSDLTVFD